MKVDFKKMIKAGVDATAKHAPEILIGEGVVCLLATTVLAVKATPKALKHIEEEKRKLGKDKLTVKETVKCCWKDYAVAGCTAIVGTTSTIGGAVVGNKRNAVATAAAAAGKVSEQLLDEYKDAVRATVTPAKQDEISSRVAEKHFGEDERVRPYEHAPEGKQWFRESSTGQRFLSTVPEVKAAFAKANENIAFDNHESLNDVLWNLGCEQVSSASGDTRGWRDKIRYRLSPVILPGGNGTGFEIQYDKDPTELWERY